VLISWGDIKKFQLFNMLAENAGVCLPKLTEIAISSNQTITGTKTFSTSPVVPTQTQGDNSTKVASALSSYLTTSSASATYQPIASMTSYPQLSKANTFSNANEYSSDLITNKMVEKFTTGTVSSNSLSIDDI
jgi:hypothetical protein